jgi:hypothetical protein
MRYMTRDKKKWKEVPAPADPLKWLCQHDSVDIDAMVIDNGPPKVYYVSHNALLAEVEKEGKTAATFYDLSRILLASTSADVTTSAAWCAAVGKLCSEVKECGGECTTKGADK